ncbi:MAG: amino acid adenylation domain-containing protein [Scytonema sp. PMC 1069.18]|nr:amino acid adenylation domain-containing protein [Scytonema sp. PMC 1069.18]MEC4882219.1 amino acid adenylation domain-containing protein [Scytonema sp. PMC 1070.18]
MNNDLTKKIASLSPAKRALLERRLKQQKANDSEQQVISRNSYHSPLPLSFTQQRMWFGTQLKPNSPLFNVVNAVEINGFLNVEVLQQALDAIVERHTVLRSTIKQIDGEPVQIIAPSQKVTIQYVDLREVAVVERKNESQRFINEEIQRPFNLESGPVLRLTLLHLDEAEYVLLLTNHHIVSDDWSIAIFWRELITLYSAFSTGKPSPLSELPIQYADFAVWQRQWLRGEVLESQLNYWKQQLKDLPVLELPTDRPRPPVQSNRGAWLPVSLPQDLSYALKELSTTEGVTLFMTLLAAFQTLLYRYTGQEDITVGTPIAGRKLMETEELIGIFINTLPLRSDLSDNPSFEQLLGQVRSVALSAYAHQHLPFEKLVEELQPERDLSRSPLFSVMFIFQNTPMFALELPGMTLTPLEIHNGTAQFDLTFDLIETSSGIKGRLEYSTDLFDASTISRMIGHFQTLLEGIVANPRQRLSELPLLTDIERHQLLVEWNNTQVDYPQDQCIHQLFEEQVERTPDAVAVVYENQQLTYHQLNCRANQLAHYLQTLGVGADVLVGICVERSLEMVVGILGILKAGGAYVPLDPEYPQERLSFMLKDTQVKVLLTQEKLVESLPKHPTHIICLDTEWQVICQSNHDNLISKVQGHNLAYVIYTSGSTGLPKGVMNTHMGIHNRLLWMQQSYQLTSSDRVVQKTPFSFDVSVWEFFWPLLTGARIVVALPEGHKDSAYLVNLISTQEITTIHFVPSMLQVFLLQPNLASCSCLKRVFCSGEALPFELTQRFFSQLECELHNLYGPTEAAIDVTFWQCLPQNNLQIVPIGRPISNTQIYILNKYLQPVPIGVTGELYIGGNCLARSYLNRPELTQERFIPNPFPNFKSERLYKTGDLARYLSNGNIDYIGRIDNQVKIRGFRIELGEIEAVICSHPNVLSSVVIAREDVVGDKRIVAYVVVKPEQTSVQPSTLRGFLFEQLPEYMIPIAFVFLESLPLTPNGKVDRRALPAPDTSDFSRSKAFVAPRNSTEEILVAIWEQVLGLDTIGIYDNFFSLGGHSLLAMQVISRIRQAFGVEIPLQLLFKIPTVADLATAITKSQNQSSGIREYQIIARQANRDSLPLSFAQERLWFLAQLELDSAAYHIIKAVKLQGELNIEVLQQSLDAIVAYHEALRTNFIAPDGNPVQVISEPRSVDLVVRDFQNCSEIEQLLQYEAQRPFNLTSDLMLRGCLLVRSPQEHILLLVMHHIASDGWSMSILFERLSSLYQAFKDGLPNPLLDLPIQYSDFAVWQRQWFSGQVENLQLNYWKQQLTDASPILQLPTDRPRPPVQTYRGARQYFLLPQNLSTSLRILSRQEGVTLFMSLLAAFQTLLYRYSGQEDILVGSPIAGRNRTEIEGIIGFFVNTLVIRTDMSGNPSFRELLKRVQGVAMSAYIHQDLPFEKLVEQLQPERSLSYNPLFQVMFVLQNTPKQSLELPGLILTPIDLEWVTSKFDLTLFVEETPQELRCIWEYSTDLFDAATIERMSRHFQVLLEGLVVNPQQCICELPLLADAEKQQILVEWNNTQIEYPDNQCIHQLFEQQVEQTPDAVAVVYEDQQLTYRELNVRANKLAHHLQTLGVEPEMLVGISMERSVEMVVGMLGILKAGGAYVPLDPTYPKQRLCLMLEDAQPKLLLTQQHLLERLPHDGRKVVCIDSDWEAIAQKNADNLPSLLKASNLAYVIYTSGSTGQPKGVAVPHQAISRLLFNTNYINLDKSDRIAQVSNVSFDAATFEIWGALVHGAQLIGFTKDIVLSPDEFTTKLQEQQISTLFLTTALLNHLAYVVPKAFKNLRHLLFGGEVADINSVKAILNNGSPQRFIHVYGPTECTTFSTWYLIEDVPEAATTLPIGRPITNTQTYILDRYLQPVPIGVIGELYIGGPGLAIGYLNRPELTAQKFIPNPFGGLDQGRLYKTGDLVRYLPDGNIEFVGRIDNQVKIRGFRIELGEIETLLSQHPCIQSAVVIVRQDTPGEKRLVAYVVPNQNQATTLSDLRQFLKPKLPEYMIPVAFVILDVLPLTPNGKVNRHALPAPEQVGQELEQSFVAPRNHLEQQLKEIWEQVLNVKPISVQDNFFEIGGHSLLAVRLFAQIQEKFGQKLPFATLLSTDTIAALAEVLSPPQKISSNQVLATSQQHKQDSFLCLVPIQPHGSKPPFFCIHPAGGDVLCYKGLAMHLGNEQPFYGLQSLGLDEQHPPLTRIEDMAALYIQEMQTIQPTGPYYLGGFSLGGVIAYEMAQQLCRQGQQVGLIAMLDSGVPGCLKRVPFSERIFIHINNFFRFGLSYLNEKLHRWSKWSKLFLTEKYNWLLGKSQPSPETESQIFIVNKQAWTKYSFPPYSGRITLFRIDPNSRDAQVALTGIQADPLLGWGNVITSGIDLHDIPGAHGNLLVEPHVQVLAQKLKQCLETAYIQNVNS